jgi:hypothetical protein
LLILSSFFKENKAKFQELQDLMQPKKKFGFKGNKKKQTSHAAVTEDKKEVKATKNYQTEGMALHLQAALVIRGFAIRGFDYSRTRKQGKTANNEGKSTILAYFWPKLVVLVFADSEFLRNVTPASSEGNLYLLFCLITNHKGFLTCENCETYI